MSRLGTLARITGVLALIAGPITGTIFEAAIGPVLRAIWVAASGIVLVLLIFSGDGDDT